MKKTIKECADETLLRTLGISYDEYEKLDFDEQQRLMSEYHKKHPNKSKEVTVMIGGGDESIFIKVPRGEKVLTPNGYFIAGETLEENRKKFEEHEQMVIEKEKKFYKRLDKENQPPRLDFKTWLYLYITKALKVEHIPVVEVKDKRRMYVKDSKENEVYIFKDYDEYRKFFLMYLNDIEDDVIDLAIYTRGNKGQVIALKGLCEHIIVKKKVNDFYSSISQEQIDEIHAKGKLTPLEVVQLWESFDLCIEGSLSANRCQYFKQNCHECLMESASHKLEYEPIELVLNNLIKEEQTPVLKKTRK